MDNFFKELKKEFNKVNVDFKKIIKFQKFTQVSSNYSEYTFDVVFKDQNKNILFLGYVSDVSFDFFLNEKTNFYDFVDDLEEDVFLFFIEDKRVLRLNHYKFVDLIPVYGIDKFISKIKDDFPSTRTEIDNLNFEIVSLTNKFRSEKNELINEKQKLLTEYNQKIKNLDFNVNYYKEKLNEKEFEITSLNNQISILVEDILFRLKVYLKNNNNFLELSNKIDRPKEVEVYSETRTPTGVYKSISMIYNSSTSDYFTIFKNKVYLRIKTYDYHSKGRIDLPETIYSNSIYYVLDDIKNEFIKIENLDYNFWIEKNKLN
jgi:hypothetical protein